MIHAFLSLSVGSFARAAAVSAAVLFATPAMSEPSDLAGSWSGGGSVMYTTGAKEKARCRASINRAGGSSYAMSATCATASGKVVQATTLRKTGGSSYSGRYRNADYNVEGTIRVSQSGNSINVTTTTDTGAVGSFSMRRQ
jgi:hypothetical protein